MKSPVVKKTPAKNSPTPRKGKKNGAGAVTPKVTPGKVVGKSPGLKKGGKGNQTPVGKGKKAQLKKAREEEEEEEEEESDDDHEELETSDDVDDSENEFEMDAEKGESSDSEDSPVVESVKKTGKKGAQTPSANGEKSGAARVSVGEWKEPSSRQAICVENLPFDATEEEVKELFDDCGEIESVRLIRDHRTQRSKGFGYVNFVERDSVDLAMKKGEVKLKGRVLKIEERLGNESENGVFIGNMPFECINEDNLRKFFADCGSVTRVRIAKNNGKLTGYAIVIFSETSEAKKALTKSGEKMGNRTLVIRPAGAGPKVVSISNLQAKTIFDAFNSLENLLRGLDGITSIGVVKRDAFAALVTCDNPDSVKTLLSKNGVTLGGSSLTIALTDAKSTGSPLKRKSDFNGTDKEQGVSKKAKTVEKGEAKEAAPPQVAVGGKKASKKNKKPLGKGKNQKK